MEVNKTTHRRCLRFSLRTLLVLVTAVCIYLGWTMNWIRQRRQFLAREVVSHSIEMQTAEPVYVGDDGHAQFGWIQPEPPWVLGVLGEQGIGQIIIQMPQDEIEARRLFPESQVWIGRLSSPGDNDLP